MKLLADLIQDLRYGARALRRAPGFTALVVLSLALGIGANAAMFGLADAVFFRTLPVRDPGALVFLSDPIAGGSVDGLPRGQLDLFSQRLYQRVRDEGRSFEDLAAQDSSGAREFVRMGGAADEATDDRAVGRAATPNFFEVLGVPAFRGRTFLPDDGSGPEPAPVAVLGHAYWLRRFGGDPNVVGARVTIGRKPVTVVGIAAPGFVGLEVGSPTDFWLPIARAITPPLAFRQENRWLRVVGRLKAGVSPATAQVDVNLTFQRYLAEDASLAADRPAREAIHIALSPAGSGVSSLRQTFRDPMLALMAGVAVLLLIVCLNVSHLLLARAMNRQREISIRTALGASRWRLVRQLLAEGLLLSLLGGAAATLVTRWLGDALIGLGSTSTAPFKLDVGLDAPVVWLIALLTLGTALAMGLVPAWQASRASLQPALRATASSITAAGSRRLVSRMLLSSQVAFSLVLLVGAGLLAGSLGQLRAIDKGFDEQGVLLVTMSSSLTDLTEDQAVQLNQEIRRRVSALPEVRSTSLSRMEPIGAGRWIEGIVDVEDKRATLVRLTAVTEGYFDSLGMKLRQGRPLARTDDATAAKVAVINESLARQVFAGRSPLGARFQFDLVMSPSQALEMITVVGVVKDAKNADLRDAAEPMAYLSAAQRKPEFLGNLQVRTAVDPAGMRDRIRRAVLEAHPDLRVTGVRTMRTQVERLLVQERLLATLSTAFGLAALFLMSIGLYGVVSQWAAQRTREIGVRIALGATSGGVRWMVLRQAFLLVLAGVAVGTPVALASARLLRGLLFGVSPLHPTPLLLAALVLFSVATLAAYLPARRASRVDPMMALRSE